MVVGRDVAAVVDAALVVGGDEDDVEDATVLVVGIVALVVEECLPDPLEQEATRAAIATRLVAARAAVVGRAAPAMGLAYLGLGSNPVTGSSRG